MSDDEFDALRERIETLEAEYDIDHDPDDGTDELIDSLGDYCKTWFKVDAGWKDYYFPANSVDMACDGWRDSDVRHQYEFAVTASDDGDIETLERDGSATMSSDIVPMSRGDVQSELRGVANE